MFYVELLPTPFDQLIADMKNIDVNRTALTHHKKSKKKFFFESSRYISGLFGYRKKSSINIRFFVSYEPAKTVLNISQYLLRCRAVYFCFALSGVLSLPFVYNIAIITYVYRCQYCTYRKQFKTKL